MANEYDFNEIEEKWQKFWDNSKTYKTYNELDNKQKCYILDMFPYPSGNGLHMGHPLGYTGTDIYSRFKKMQGYNVLHTMGFDAFGLPAEQYAIKTGNHPQEFTKKNCEIFRTQLKKLGFCYDWDREISTTDQDYYKWTQWIFTKLFNSYFDEEQQKARPITELKIPQEIKNKGDKAISDYQAQYRLAYMDDAMVNWCPELGTVLANEEVIDGKSEVGGFDVIRKPMKQWLLRITKYADRLINELDEIDWPSNIKEQQINWIGKKYGSEIQFNIKNDNNQKGLSLTAFTTRPDTLFGVTFFVISTEHPLVDSVTIETQKQAVNDYCQQASIKSEKDRTMENRQKTGVWTGSYVINPITKEEVPLYVGDYVLMGFGTGAVMGVPSHDERDFEFAKKFNIPIRPVLVPESNDLELVDKVQSGKMFWTETGKMLDLDYPLIKELQICGISNEQAKKVITNWLEENNLGKKVVNYRLRDWLFSRQRYWGEPIPVVHWEDGTITAIEDENLPLLLPEVEDYKPSEGGLSPLAKAKEWLSVTCPKTGKKGLRETNTMPQWAGSCWYYLRFMDPKNSLSAWDSEIEKHWGQVDLYVGGAEHAVLHLLYARFWHKVLYDLGYVSYKEPFKKLFNQGMLVSYAYKDERGALIPVDEVVEKNGKFYHLKTEKEVQRITAKMSKSLKNVVTPDEIISEYGADTLRMFLMFLAPLEAMKSWDPKAITGVHRFIKKYANYAFEKIEKNNFIEDSAESIEVQKATHQLIKKVTDDLESLKFNTPVSSFMEYLNFIFDKEISRLTLSRFTVLLYCYAPHITEEVWQGLGNNQSLFFAKFPNYDTAMLKQDKVVVAIQINGKKRSTVEVDPQIDQESLTGLVVESMQNTNYNLSKEDKFITVFNPGTKVPRLVNVIIKSSSLVD